MYPAQFLCILSVCDYVLPDSFVIKQAVIESCREKGGLCPNEGLPNFFMSRTNLCYSAFLFIEKALFRPHFIMMKKRVVSITTRGHSAQSTYVQHSDTFTRDSHNTAKLSTDS